MKGARNPMRRCVILGGGGHARVLIDAILLVGQVELHGILLPDESLWGSDVFGVPVLGGDALLSSLVAQGVDSFVVGLGSVGDSSIREKLYHYGLDLGLDVLSVCHPAAILSPRARYGRGGQFLPGSIVNAGAVIGENVIVNSGAIVEHDCQIGDHVHIATGAHLSGTVQIGEGAHIGTGAIVRQGIKIGTNALVGAGAVVVKDVPPDTLVTGVPAHPRQTST
ncbi:MAG: acetyltransferase [Anaerolineaceae bacterium]|nr:acetyltransferase [Anaerolineaceae bacterium]